MRARLLNSLTAMERELLTLHDQERSEALEREREAVVRHLRKVTIHVVPVGTSGATTEPDFSLDAIASPHEGEYVEDGAEDLDEPAELTLDVRLRKADWLDVMQLGCYDEGLDTATDVDELSCDIDGLTGETRWDALESVECLECYREFGELEELMFNIDYTSEDIDFSSQNVQMTARELYLWLHGQIERALYIEDFDTLEWLNPYFLAIIGLFDVGDGVDDVVRWLEKRTTRAQRRGRLSDHEEAERLRVIERYRKAEAARIAALPAPQREEILAEQQEAQAVLELIGEAEPEPEPAATTPKAVTSSRTDPILAAMGLA